MRVIETAFDRFRGEHLRLRAPNLLDRSSFQRRRCIDRIPTGVVLASSDGRNPTVQYYVAARFRPQDLAALIESKVKAGAYASVSDVVADGVRALQDDDAELERWLRDEVTRGHAEYLADPSRAVPAEELLDRIKARRRKSAPP